MIKKIILLITLIFIFYPVLTEAQETGFHQEEYIDAWMHRVDGSTIYYQKARFIRRNIDQHFAYCIEPFGVLDEKVSYESMEDKTKERMSLIAYYGYGYKNHTDPIWYAITQMMIWKEAEPDHKMYFANNPLEQDNHQYDKEMDEIYWLVNHHYDIPSFNNQNYNFIKGDHQVIDDTNQTLYRYDIASNTNMISKQGNQLIIDATSTGTDTVTMKIAEKNYTVPPLYYYHHSSQNVMVVGQISFSEAKLNIKVESGSIIIVKEDSLEKEKESFPQIFLEGAIIGLYDENSQLLKTTTIDDDHRGYFNDLSKGSYEIKELVPGIGYNLQTKSYHLVISEVEINHTITIENSPYLGEVIIEKKYGDQDSLLPEANIVFSFYNDLNELVGTITTDDKGYGSILLPIGTYLVKQTTSTDGFQKVDDFIVTITQDRLESYKYSLIDWKIPVPDTFNKETINISPFILIIASGGCLYYVKKSFIL